MPPERKEINSVPSPFGEGQTDTPINHGHLGEVPDNRWLRIVISKTSEVFAKHPAGETSEVWFTSLLLCLSHFLDFTDNIIEGFVCKKGFSFFGVIPETLSELFQKADSINNTEALYKVELWLAG